LNLSLDQTEHVELQEQHKKAKEETWLNCLTIESPLSVKSGETQNAKRRTQNAERRTQNAERRTQNAERNRDLLRKDAQESTFS
jgi:hypothetical protein